MERMTVNGKPYTLLRLLGKGKGGYSWLAEGEHGRVVVKQIHHEPCSYYTFGDKMQAERRDYGLLRAAGIRIPKLLDMDFEAERIVKEYIEGDTIAQRLQSGRSAAPYLPQVREMSAQARAAGLNIDYYPTNFVVCCEVLYYIDFECNPFDEKWSFEVWGLPYWTQPELLEGQA